MIHHCGAMLEPVEDGSYCRCCNIIIPGPGVPLVNRLGMTKRMARVLEDGMKHDAEGVPGWEGGVNIQHELTKALKHYRSWRRSGVRRDKDSGEHPLVHVMIRLGKIVYEETRRG